MKDFLRFMFAAMDAIFPIAIGTIGLYLALFSTQRQSLGVILAVMTYYFFILRGRLSGRGNPYGN